VIRETLQSFRVDTLILLAFTAGDNHPLAGDGEASGTPALTAPRVCEPLIESPQLSEDWIGRRFCLLWRPTACVDRTA
jgi:hypothetical protein